MEAYELPCTRRIKLKTRERERDLEMLRDLLPFRFFVNAS